MRVYSWRTTWSRTFLVVGIPNDEVGGVRNAGAVQVFGDDPADDRRITQAGRWMPGKPERGDRFGAVIADLPYPEADLLVGAPWDGREGTVTVVPWAASGVDPRYPGLRPTLLLPGTAHIPVEWASFGTSLAAHDRP